MRRPPRLTGAVLTALLLCPPALAASAPPPDNPAACGGQPFHFQLADVYGRIFTDVGSVSQKPIVLAYYSGYKSAPTHEPLREQLRHDPQIGSGGKLRDTWAGFAIVDYKEGWYVPAWAVDKALREKMARYPTALFLTDRGECLTRAGTSDKCPGPTHQRHPYFRSNVGTIVVIYHGAVLAKIEGHTDPNLFIQRLRRLAEQAQAGTSYCQAKQIVGW